MNELNKQHVDACRFCWMCRHICPIGNATGLERNTSRARALGLSLVNRNVYGIEEVADNLYECACCGACTEDCVTGWDPVMFTKAARLDAALEGKLPEYINVLVDNCLDAGNAYGKKDFCDCLKAEIKNHTAKEDTLLFLGVDARFMAEKSAVNAIKALEKAGVKFTVLADEPTSGAQLEYLISAADETKAQMAECAKVLNNYKTVIAYDPQDALVLKRTYAEFGIELNCEVVTFTTVLADALKNGALKVAKTDKALSYQDPFQLSRDLLETEPAREVVKACGNLTEMLCFGKATIWAGNILMASWIPEVMEAVAANRITNAKNMGAKAIVTASVSEYVSLKKVAQNDVEIISIEELVLA